MSIIFGDPSQHLVSDSPPTTFVDNRSTVATIVLPSEAFIPATRPLPPLFIAATRNADRAKGKSITTHHNPFDHTNLGNTKQCGQNGEENDGCPPLPAFSGPNGLRNDSVLPSRHLGRHFGGGSQLPPSFCPPLSRQFNQKLRQQLLAELAPEMMEVSAKVDCWRGNANEMNYNLSKASTSPVTMTTNNTQKVSVTFYDNTFPEKKHLTKAQKKSRAFRAFLREKRGWQRPFSQFHPSGNTGIPSLALNMTRSPTDMSGSGSVSPMSSPPLQAVPMSAHGSTGPFTYTPHLAPPTPSALKPSSRATSARNRAGNAFETAGTAIIMPFVDSLAHAAGGAHSPKRLSFAVEVDNTISSEGGKGFAGALVPSRNLASISRSSGMIPSLYIQFEDDAAPFMVLENCIHPLDNANHLRTQIVNKMKTMAGGEMLSRIPFEFSDHECIAVKLLASLQHVYETYYEESDYITTIHGDAKEIKALTRLHRLQARMLEGHAIRLRNTIECNMSVDSLLPTFKTPKAVKRFGLPPSGYFQPYVPMPPPLATPFLRMNLETVREVIKPLSAPLTAELARKETELEEMRLNAKIENNSNNNNNSVTGTRSNSLATYSGTSGTLMPSASAMASIGIRVRATAPPTDCGITPVRPSFRLAALEVLRRIRWAKATRYHNAAMACLSQRIHLDHPLIRRLYKPTTVRLPIIKITRPKSASAEDNVIDAKAYSVVDQITNISVLGTEQRDQQNAKIAAATAHLESLLGITGAAAKKKGNVKFDPTKRRSSDEGFTFMGEKTSRMRQVNLDRLAQDLAGNDVPLTWRDGNGLSLLHYAVLREDKGVVTLLCRHNIDVCYASNDGRTAAHLLLARQIPTLRKLELINALFTNSSADALRDLFDKKDYKGYTIMEYATMRCDFDVVKTLYVYLEAVKGGPTVKERRALKRYYSLEDAITHCNLDIIKWHFDVLKTPLECLVGGPDIISGGIPVLSFALQLHPNLSRDRATPKGGATNTSTAVNDTTVNAHDYERDVNQRKRSNVDNDTSISPSSGPTPDKYREMLMWLIVRGLPSTICDSNARNSFHYAARCGAAGWISHMLRALKQSQNSEQLDVLALGKAVLNADVQHQTMLHTLLQWHPFTGHQQHFATNSSPTNATPTISAQDRRLLALESELLPILSNTMISPNLDPSHADSYGNTLLHWAVASGSAAILAVVARPIQYDTNEMIHKLCAIRNNDGDTALALAVRSHFAKGIEILMARSVTAEVFLSVLGNGDRNMFLLAVDAFAAAESFGGDHIGIMDERPHCATRKGGNCADALLRAAEGHGIDVRKYLDAVSGPRGETPLHSAIRNRMWHMAALLLTHHASSTALNVQGVSALELACSDPDDAHFAKLLLSNDRSAIEKGSSLLACVTLGGAVAYKTEVLEEFFFSRVAFNLRQTELGHEMLKAAAKTGNLKLLRFVIECGARALENDQERAGELDNDQNTTSSVLAIFLRTVRLALHDGPTRRALAKKSQLVRYFTTPEGLQECLELATLMVKLGFRITQTILCDAIACDLPTFVATLLALPQITPEYLDYRDAERGDTALHMATRKATHGEGAARWNTIVFSLCERSNKTNVTNNSDETPLTIAIHNNNPLVAVRLILSGHHFSMYLGTLHIVLRPINNDFLESKRSLSVQTMSLMSATWLRSRIGWKRSTILADAVCGGRMDIIGLFAQAAHRTHRHTFAELLMAPFDDSWRLVGETYNKTATSTTQGIDARLDCVLTYAAARAPALCFELMLSHCPILSEAEAAKAAANKTSNSTDTTDAKRPFPLQLQFGAVRAALMRAITHGRTSNAELLISLLAQMPPPAAAAPPSGALSPTAIQSQDESKYSDSFQVYCEHPTLLHALAATPYKTKRMFKIFLQLITSDLDSDATAIYQAQQLLTARDSKQSTALPYHPPTTTTTPRLQVTSSHKDLSSGGAGAGKIGRTTSAVRFLPVSMSDSPIPKEIGEVDHTINISLSTAADQSASHGGNVVALLQGSHSLVQTPLQQSKTQNQPPPPPPGLSIMAVSNMSVNGGQPSMTMGGPPSVVSSEKAGGVMAASVRSEDSPAYVSTYPFEHAPSVLALLLRDPERWLNPADDDDRDDFDEDVTDVVAFSELITYNSANRLQPSIDARSLGAPLESLRSGAPLARVITDIMLRALLQVEQYDVYEDAVPSSDDSDNEAQDTLLHPTDFFTEKSKNEKSKRGGFKGRRQSAHSFDAEAAAENGVARTGSNRVVRTRFREPSIANTLNRESQAGETEPDEENDDADDEEMSQKNSPRDPANHVGPLSDGGNLTSEGMFLQPTIVINAHSVEERHLTVPVGGVRTPRDNTTVDEEESRPPAPTTRRASAATAQLADNPHLFASMNATATNFGLSTTSVNVPTSVLNGGVNGESQTTNGMLPTQAAPTYAENMYNNTMIITSRRNSNQGLLSQNNSFGGLPLVPHIANPFIECLNMFTLEHIFRHKLLHSVNHIVSHLGMFPHLRGQLCQHVFADGRRFLDVLVSLALPNTVIKKGIDAAREETQSWRARGTWWIETLLDVRHSELIRRIPAPTRSAYPTLSLFRDMARSDPTTVPSLSEAHYEDTPLHASIRKGRKKITAHILQSTCAEVDVNAKNIKGRTPLMLAAMLNRTECASQLVSTGVDVMIEDVDGMTALHHAAAAGSASIVELVLADDDGSEAACNASTKPLASYPVLQALKNGKDDCAYELLTSLASERAPKQISIVRTGETLLHFAAMTNCTMAMEVLLANASPSHLHSVTIDGCTCRDYCAVGSSMDLLLRMAGVPRLAPHRNPRPVTLSDIANHKGLVANALRDVSSEGKAFITGCNSYGLTKAEEDALLKTASTTNTATEQQAPRSSNQKRPNSSKHPHASKGNDTAAAKTASYPNVSQTSSVDALSYQAATEGNDELLLSHLKLGATDSVRIRIYNLPHPGVTEKERAALKREVAMALLPFGGINGMLTFPEGSPFSVPTGGTSSSALNASGAQFGRTSSQNFNASQLRRTASLGSSEDVRSDYYAQYETSYEEANGADGSGSPTSSPLVPRNTYESQFADAYGLIILADDSKVEALLKKQDLLLRKRSLVFVRDTPKGPSYRTSARPGVTGLLHLICKTNCFKSLQFIIDSNSVVSILSKKLLELLSSHYDEAGLTPYHHTVLSGSWNCLAIFLKAQIPAKPAKGCTAGPPLTCFASHAAMYDASLVVPSTLWSLGKGKITDWVSSSTIASPTNNLITTVPENLFGVGTLNHSQQALHQSQTTYHQYQQQQHPSSFTAMVQSPVQRPSFPLPTLITPDSEELTGARFSVYDDGGALHYATRAGDRRLTRLVITAGLDKLIEAGVEALHWRLIKELFADIHFEPNGESSAREGSTETFPTSNQPAATTSHAHPEVPPPPPLNLPFEAACLRELVKEGIESLVVNANADDFDARDSSTEREHFKAIAMFHLAGGVLYRQLHDLFDSLLHTAPSGVYGWLCASKLHEVTFAPMQSEEEARSKGITIRRKLPEAEQASLVGAIKNSVATARAGSAGRKGKATEANNSDSDYDIVEENALNGPRLVKKNRKGTGASDGPADSFGTIHVTIPFFVNKRELICKSLTSAFEDYFSTTAVAIAIDILHELDAIRKMIGGPVELVVCDRYCAIVHRLVAALANKRYISESVEEAADHADAIAAELQSAISKTNNLTVADVNGRLTAALWALQYTHRHIIALAPPSVSLNPNASFTSFSGITVNDYSASSTPQQPPVSNGYLLQLAKGPMIHINPKKTTLKIAFSFSAMKREVFDTNILNSIGNGWEGIGASHRLKVQQQYENAAPPASIPYKLATLVLGCALDSIVVGGTPRGGGGGNCSTTTAFESTYNTTSSAPTSMVGESPLTTYQGATSDKTTSSTTHHYPTVNRVGSQNNIPNYTNLSVGHFGAFCGSSWKHRQYALYQWSLGGTTTLAEAFESLEAPIRIVNEHRGQCAFASKLPLLPLTNKQLPTFLSSQQPTTLPQTYPTSHQTDDYLLRRHTAISDTTGGNNSHSNPPFYQLSAVPTGEGTSGEFHPSTSAAPAILNAGASNKHSSSTTLSAAQTSSTTAKNSRVGGTQLPAWVEALKARIEDVVPILTDKIREMPPQGWTMTGIDTETSIMAAGESYEEAYSTTESWSLTAMPGKTDVLSGTATFSPMNTNSQSRKLSIIRQLQKSSLNPAPATAHSFFSNIALSPSVRKASAIPTAAAPNSGGLLPSTLVTPSVSVCQRYSPSQWVRFVELLFEMTHDFQLVLYTVALSCKTWRSAVCFCLRNNAFGKILSVWVVETAMATESLLNKARLTVSQREQYGWMAVPVGARTAVKSWLCVEAMRTMHQKSTRRLRKNTNKSSRRGNLTIKEPKTHEQSPKIQMPPSPITTDAAYCEAVDDAYKLFLKDPHASFRWCVSVVGIERVAIRRDLPENKFASRTIIRNDDALSYDKPTTHRRVPHLAKVIQMCFKREAAAAELSAALCRLSAKYSEAPSLAPNRLISLCGGGAGSYNYTGTPNITFGYNTTTSSNATYNIQTQNNPQLLSRSAFQGQSMIGTVTEGGSLLTTSPSKILHRSVVNAPSQTAQLDAFQIPLQVSGGDLTAQKILPNRRGSRALYGNQ